MVWKYFFIGLIYSTLLKITLERKHIKSYVLNLQIGFFFCCFAVFKRKKRKTYLFLKVHVAQWRCLAYRSVQKNSKCVLYSFAIKITFQFAVYHCNFKMLLALCNRHDLQLYLTSNLIFFLIAYISGIARNLVYKIFLIHNQILPGLVTNIYTPHLFCLSITAHPVPF